MRSDKDIVEYFFLLRRVASDMNPGLNISGTNTCSEQTSR